jgi:hypothetical protein
MIVERFKNRNPVPIYERLRERGRLMETDDLMEFEIVPVVPSQQTREIFE